MPDKKKIHVLYSEIGRSRPFCLDGTIEALQGGYGDRVEINASNVFRLSQGISFRGWRSIDRADLKSGGPGIFLGTLYNESRPFRKNFFTRLLMRDIRSYYRHNPEAVLTAHPLLAQALSDATDVIYLHGDSAVLSGAVINRASLFLVPTESAARRYIESGIPEKRVRIVGLFIGKALISDHGVDIAKREARISDKETLVGAFYTARCETSGHIEKVLKMLESLDRDSQRGVVFCRAGGAMERSLMKNLDCRRYVPGKKEERFHEAVKKNNILIVIYNERKQLDNYFTEMFKYLDYLVAPPLELTDWSLGMGVPFFVLNPPIGPYAESNRKLLLESGTATEIDSIEKAGDFSAFLGRLRESGKLLEMSRNGYGKYGIDGFAESAKAVIDYLEKARTI